MGAPAVVTVVTVGIAVVAHRVVGALVLVDCVILLAADNGRCLQLMSW